MRVSFIALASVAAGIVAAKKNNGDVEEILIESWEAFGPTLAASILASDTTATTYVLGCAANVEPTDCGFVVPIIATHGPSTMYYNRKFIDEGGSEYDITQDFACAVDAKRAATCTYSYSGPYLTHPKYLAQSDPPYTVSTTTIRNDNLLSAYASVQIVTDSAEILSYGTDVHGQPTIYVTGVGADDATSTELATAPADASQISQTSSAKKTKVLTWEVHAPTGSSTAPASEATAPTGFSTAASVSLSVLAAVAFGMLIFVGAQ